MFDKMKGMMDKFQMMQRLMKDENFKAFISHPKVQELFKDPEFKDVAKSQDFTRIVSHPKFAAVVKDPEVAQLMARLNPQAFLGGGR